MNCKPNTEHSLSMPTFPKRREEPLKEINRHDCSLGRCQASHNPEHQESAITEAVIWLISSAAWRTEKMALIVAMGMILMAGICPAVLCIPDGTKETDIIFHDNQDNGTQDDSLTLASINNDFAFSLYKELALKNPDKNIVFSPLSISAALVLLSLGAKGKTMEEILEGLKFNLTEISEADIHQGFAHLIQRLSQPEEQEQINVGNAMFIGKHLQILAEFQEKTRSLYQTEAFTADFHHQPSESIKLINDYVSNKTQGMIKELISKLDENTLMVLVNYIYFKGKWKISFDPQDTFESEFYLDEKQSVKVPMMKMKNIRLPYFRDEELNCSVVELKYTGNASALFILPDQGKMQQVEASLQPETLKKWRKTLIYRSIDGLYLPKFSISTDFRLDDVLPEMGIAKVFSEQADLSGITETRKMSVSQVVHKAVLEVAETGTEAAAATAVTSTFKSFPLQALCFNRPFLMVISHTGVQSVLFMAKVTDPE